MTRYLKIEVDGPLHMEGYGLEGNARKEDLPGIIDLLQRIAKSKSKQTLKDLCSPTVGVCKIG